MHHDFLDRNRLIAGFSDFVIVTEAAAKSGSLNTAAHALRMGIPVGAVPGPITNSLSSGTNWLIQQGAHLITSSQDVLDILNIKESPEQMSLLGADDVETTILQALHQQSTDLTGLAATTNIDTKELLSTLTMLEIHGRVQQDQAGNWHLL
jgi:DNA processing protein